MRVLATVCFAFAGGILAAQYLLPPQLLPYAAAGCLILGLLWAAALRGDNRLRAVLLSVGLAAALAWNGAYVRFVQAPLESMVGSVRTLTMEALDYPSATDYGYRVEVRILERGLHGRAIYYGGAALLAVEPGMRLTAPVSVNSAAVILGTAISTHVSRGVFLLLYERGEAIMERGRADSLRYLPQCLARRMQDAIGEVFPERTRAFMKAILLGDKYDLDTADKVHLSEAGLYHVTAVSGLHCGFLIGVLGFLIGWKHAKAVAVIGIPLLVFYALMVGLTPSVTRACVMFSVSLLALAVLKEADPPTSLGLALFLILLHNPFAIKSVSLQLSFAAMAGMILITSRLTERIRLGRYGRLGRYLFTPLSVTVGALIFTIPLSAIYFGNLVLVAVFSNLLGLWAASVTFASGLLATLLGVLHFSIARYVAFLPHFGAMWLLSLARLLSGIPYHGVYFSNPYLKLWLIYVYAMLITCVLLKGRFRYRSAGVLALATLVLVIFLNIHSFRDSALHLVALDVGQGQSVVLHAGSATALLDCGSSSYLDAGDVAADYLQSVGVEAIDYLLISHYHDDHCDGLPTLLARLPVKQLLLPDIAPDDPLRAKTLALALRYNVPVTFVREDATFSLGDAALTVYAPLDDSEMNEACLIALCSIGSFDALFTADVDTGTEEQLLATRSLPDIEVMMAGHHGSKYSTGKDLLAATTPETAIVSCGADNRYGHPNPEALRRLSRAGAAVYRTDLQGNIHITVNNED